MFFNAHRTSSTKETKYVSFLTRQNQKKHFVEKTISKIGYPRWDKAITSKKRISIGSSMHRNASDSVEVVYVPFVRDTQTHVYASLIIQASATDTLFSYITDWEYSRRPHGSPLIDTSAERHALFFMMMNRAVFGYSEFILTDTTLFGGHPRASDTTLRHITLINPGSSNVLIWETCLSYYVCGSPNSSYCTGADGCDYDAAGGCASPGTCYQFEICWEEDFVIPPYTPWSGGAGSGGDGGGGGSGSGGETGGGEGTPPDCQAGSGYGRTYFNEHCGPGWNPLNDPQAPASLSSVNTSAITNPCLKALIDSLGTLGVKSYIIRQYYLHNFIPPIPDLYSVRFTEDYTLVDAGGQPIPGRTTISTLGNRKEILIKLNPALFANSTNEWVTTVILHELLHGIYLNKYPYLSTPALQHNEMFVYSGCIGISEALSQLYSLDTHDLLALGIDGLGDEVFYTPGTTTIDPNKNLICQQVYFQSIAQALSTQSLYRTYGLGKGTKFCP